jgi:hypothetical protein
VIVFSLFPADTDASGTRSLFPHPFCSSFTIVIDPALASSCESHAGGTVAQLHAGWGSLSVSPSLPSFTRAVHPARDPRLLLKAPPAIKKIKRLIAER